VERAETLMATRGWERVTADQIRPSADPKPSKYRNVKAMVDGRTFDSKREARHYQGLKAQEAVGEIRDLRCQVAFALLVPCLADGVNVVAASYVADFVYVTVADGRQHIVDAKGMRTQIYQLKKRWLELQNGVRIEEV
jgi:Protein of unknown function (DUF1064)